MAKDPTDIPPLIYRSNPRKVTVNLYAQEVIAEIAPGENAFNKKPGEKNSVDITNLIRSVQHSEGNPDCFRRTKDDCDPTGCAWRQYCLESDQTDKMEETDDGKNRDSLQSF